MKVIFPVEQYKKWRAYINSVQTEISGLAKILHIKPNLFILLDVQIFTQIVTSGHTNIDKAMYGDFLDELMQKGERISQWNAWWHSHANGPSYFSSVDEMTIEDWDNESEKNNYLLSIVSNRANKTQIRLDVFSPLRLIVPDVEWEISYEDSFLEEQVRQEIAQKVSEYKRPPKVIIQKTPTIKKSYTYNQKGEIVPKIPLLESTVVRGEIVT